MLRPFIAWRMRGMAYARPEPESKPGKPERKEMLEQYFSEYRAWAARDPSCLNRKVPREVFADLLDQVGALLLQQSAVLATTPGPVREFLEQNPLPPSLEGKLPD